MKRRNYRFTLLPSLLMLACAAGLMLAACTSNDDNPTADISTTPIDDTEEPGDYTGDGTFVAPDGLAWFMGHLVQTDSEGLLVGYVYGKPLDEADPTVLSVGVASAEEAEDIFRSFVADTLHVVSVAPGTVTYSPTEANSHTGTLTLTSSGATTVTVSLAGTATIEPVEPVTTTVTIYQLTSTLTAGEEYLVVSGNAAGSAYALGHSGTTVAAYGVTVKAADDISDVLYMIIDPRIDFSKK